MKRILSLIAVLSLVGCAALNPNATTQQVQVQYVQACAAYGAAFNGALQLREAGKLTAGQVSQINVIDSQMTPLCTGTLPADPAAATQQLTAAVTTLAIIEAVKGVTK